MADHQGSSVFKRLSSRPHSDLDDVASLKRFRAWPTNRLEYWLEKHRKKLFTLQQRFPDIDPLSHPQTGAFRATRRTIQLVEQVLNERDAAEATSVGTPASGVEKPADLSDNRRPGPKRDVETAQRVAAVVAGVAQGLRWTDKLDEVCERLDDEKVPCPKTWKNRDPQVRNWTVAAATERQLAIKAIAHHLKNARRS